MKLVPFIFGITTLVLATGISADQQRGEFIGAAPYETPEWFKESFLDIAEDAAESDAVAKHLILFFHLDACPYCEQVLAENFSDESQNLDYVKENFDVIAINIKGAREVVLNEETTLPENELARALGVDYTPAMIFIDGNNEGVLRINGYRAPEYMNHAFEYVRGRGYSADLSLADFIAQNGQDVYEPSPNSLFSERRDLDALLKEEQKVAILFEDKKCVLCETFNENVLADPELRSLLERFTVVRLDTGSDITIVAPDGSTTTPRDYANAIDLNFRPSLVFFIDGVETIRVDTLLRKWHYYVVLRWLDEDKFNTYERVWDYENILAEQRLAAGKNIDLRD